MSFAKRITAVALSGGADSLLALRLLQEEGRDVFGLHAFFSPPNESALKLADQLRALCRRMKLKLEVIDLSLAFEEKIISPFMRDYQAGLTPNPCSLCNREMKFGLLLESALNLGADSMATGHYAALRPMPGQDGLFLAMGQDALKDQSYFLSLVQRQRLAMAEFPLSGYLKKETLAALKKRTLAPVVKKESQDICFIPDADYRSFLLSRNLPPPDQGPVITRQGRELGQHKGLWNYTLGQRRGLGVAFSEPLYVIGKDMEANSLIVGPRSEALMTRCRAGEINFFLPVSDWPEKTLLKFRYRQPPVEAGVEYGENNGQAFLAFELKAPTEITAPGQTAAVYSEDGYVLAGGVLQP